MEFHSCGRLSFLEDSLSYILLQDVLWTDLYPYSVGLLTAIFFAPSDQLSQKHEL